MKKNVTLALFAVLLTVSSCNSTNDSVLNEDVKASNSVSNTQAKTIDEVAKQIVAVSTRITINEGMIEANEKQFNDDLNNGVIFTSQETTFSELGTVFEKYFGISAAATEDLFNVFYQNRALISQVDPKGTLLAEAIANEAEAYNIANPSEQNKIIFGVLVSIINPKGCGWGVAAGVADTAASAVLTAVTSPTGAGAVVGAISTAGFYADTVVKAARCKK